MCKTDAYEEKECDDFFHLIFGSAPIGMVLINQDFTIEAVNNQMLKYFGLKKQTDIKLTMGHFLQCDAIPCGKTMKCNQCDLYNYTYNILYKEEMLKDKIIRCNFESAKTKYFIVNGSKIKYRRELYCLLTFKDETVNIAKNIRLKERLKLDLATGALNKYSLMHIINDVIKDDKNNNFTVCMIDFDNFKEINDQYGHLMGDKVLEVFANITRENICASDIFGRYGGEEFIILFRDASKEQVLITLQVIQLELTRCFISTIKQSVTFSAGLLQTGSNTRTDYSCSDLINDVDKLLNKAKKTGKHRIVSKDGDYVFN